VKPTKCLCDKMDNGQSELFSEMWEQFFIPTDYNCGITVYVYSDYCVSFEHWSHRGDGQHDVPDVMCHHCALEYKKYNHYEIEYSKGVRWHETH